MMRKERIKTLGAAIFLTNQILERRFYEDKKLAKLSHGEVTKVYLKEHKTLMKIQKELLNLLLQKEQITKSEFDQSGVFSIKWRILEWEDIQGIWNFLAGFSMVVK